jgi:hypothetical protein
MKSEGDEFLAILNITLPEIQLLSKTVYDIYTVLVPSSSWSWVSTAKLAYHYAAL